MGKGKHKGKGKGKHAHGRRTTDPEALRELDVSETVIGGSDPDDAAAGGESVADAALSVADQPPSARPPARPNGQRLWDMPYSSAAPRMINPELGLHNLVARAGHNAGYDIDLTLLDAPDHRLIRSGVLLAHRVVDDRGEWYLGAPDWVPLLPKERIDPMSHGDLPEELADLIRPFRRRATLGPVAALRCERREFALRDDAGQTLALVRDDKVTVRRNGLTTARYREVMVTPVGPGLREDQDQWLCQVLADAGATPMTKFPRLVTRLGAPANGRTDFPVPGDLDPAARFSAFVGVLVSRRLRELLYADLEVRAGRPNGPSDLARVASRLQRELRGLAPVLDPEWADDLDADLSWLTALAVHCPDPSAPQVPRGFRPGPAPAEDAEVTALKLRLRGERHLTLLERLVLAVRSPKVVDPEGRSATDVLDALLHDAQRQMARAADRVGEDSAADTWLAVHEAHARLLHTAELFEGVEPGRFDPIRKRLNRIGTLLEVCGETAERAAATRSEVGGSSPERAFELGRRYERELAEAADARRAFVASWGKTSRKLGWAGAGRAGATRSGAAESDR